MDAPKYCPSCGAALEPNARFCGSCGQPVQAAPTAAALAGGRPAEPPAPWEVQPQSPAAPPPPQPISLTGPAQPYGAPQPAASPVPPKKKSRTGLWIAGGCLLVLVIVGVFALCALRYLSTRDGDPSGGSSSGGGAVATAAAEVGLAKGELLYSDDFSDPSSGWDIRQADDASTVYQNGAYHITVNNIDWVAWGNPYDEFTDFIVEVDATQVAGTDDNDFGVLVRYVDVDNFYRFEISSDGYYSFDMMQDNEWITLIEWTPSDAIRLGKRTNTITVRCEGDLFTFYVNGQYLDEYRDSTFASGDIGLLAGTIQEAPVHIAFDNVKVWALD